MNNNIASAWQRLLAYLIDFSLGLMPPIFLVYYLSGANSIEMILGRASFIIVFGFFVYPILYAALVSFMISTFGGTFGKLLTGTKIISSGGSNLSFWKAFFRNHIGYMVSAIFVWLGFIWILIDKEKRGWHDQIADTYVIVTNKWMSLLGVAALIGVIFTELAIISMSILNFSQNRSSYIDLTNTINSSLKTDSPTISK